MLGRTSRSIGLAASNESKVRSLIAAYDRRIRARDTGPDAEKSMVRSRVGTSCFSSSASVRKSYSTEPQSVKRLAVQVGASLKVDVSRTAAAVTVTVGDNLEEVVLRPKWMELDDCGSQGWKSFDISSKSNQVDVTQIDGVSAPGTQLPVLAQMNAQMPARWCSLDVQGGTGSVHIQTVREGSLRVRTRGGNVKFGEVKGSRACIKSSGGVVEGNVVQANSSFETGGGNLWVKKLQGASIAVDSGGGNVVLGSIYGDEVTVESMGGSVEAKEIQAQERALISSSGGSVVIDGIDGKVAVVSKGGSVDVQLNEHAEEVTIEAGKDGRVVLCLSARLTAQLQYEGPQGVVQEGSLLTSGCEFGIYEFTGQESVATRELSKSAWRGSENYLPGGITACKIHVFSAGQVHVKQRNWLDIIKSKVLP